MTLSSNTNLHLPRILCLHGGGTNERIFRAQCRVLEKNLRQFFRFCYIQAPFASQPGPDVVSVYHQFSPFRAWLDPDEDQEYIAEDVEAAIRSAIKLDNECGATGPFVGLLGFSQGAKVCGSLLARMQDCDGTLPLWRFAVLMAGRGPLLSPTGRHGHNARAEDTPAGTQPLIPTLHVHGLKDPALELHRKFLRENFDARQARAVEWDGEHRVPIKTLDVRPVVDGLLDMVRPLGILVAA